MKTRHPGLGDNPAYWRMLGYILTATHIEDDGQIVVSAGTLAQIAGKEKEHKSKNFVAGDFLKQFQEDVLNGLEFNDAWSYKHNGPYGKRKARTLTHIGMDSAEADDLRAEIKAGYRDPKTKRVDLATGRAINDSVRRERRDAIKNIIATLTPTASQPVVEYHNNLPPNTFTNAVHKRNHAAAWNAYDSIPDGLSKRHALAYLLRILEEPQPFLKPTLKSDRAYSYQPSLSTVKSNIRRAFTQGWWEYDLRYAQLAVIATLWGANELEEFLRGGGNFWQHCADGLGISRDEFKQMYKQPLYALVFGAGNTRIREEIKINGGDEAAYQAFKNLDFIDEIRTARDKRKRQIETDGKIVTTFGKVINVKERSELNSALAQEAQAVELKLMLPIYQLAQGNHTFKVMVYQFDGVTVHYSDAKRVRATEKKIMAAVEEQADALGISTKLVGAKL